jgi:DNA-binding MarR family transcriptional regulator
VTAPPTDDRRADAVSSSIDRLQRVAGRAWEPLGTELDLTEVSAQALVAIGQGASTVSAVADACGRHVSSASRIVDALVQRDLVDRREDPRDRRAVRLTLTRAGERAAARVVSAQEELLRASLAELDADDVEQLARLLSALADAVERHAPALDDL